ncbi:hypothetical protein P175DRAFT_064911 [Aspergillus ochraceoroseus IBT 24754]|uniref:Uncharacterized protein n=1 Tax=Aspergillus ochraceoroseus IBT 24754 TaxID=1392256 RepID=A0A2T5M9E6_9EURO|nr:uncharacterized protein P175DRAFT_064911 [Aspergillus ochraceoroseus IBT 24754]PTU25151.1 hypothetical protein P175DRAFT_064911 [Aspergillus ochraceoroseus IBT 24754]
MNHCRLGRLPVHEVILAQIFRRKEPTAIRIEQKKRSLIYLHCSRNSGLVYRSWRVSCWQPTVASDRRRIYGHSSFGGCSKRIRCIRRASDMKWSGICQVARSLHRFNKSDSALFRTGLYLPGHSPSQNTWGHVLWISLLSSILFLPGVGLLQAPDRAGSVRGRICSRIEMDFPIRTWTGMICYGQR